MQSKRRWGKALCRDLQARRIHEIDVYSLVGGLREEGRPERKRPELLFASSHDD